MYFPSKFNCRRCDNLWAYRQALELLEDVTGISGDAGQGYRDYVVLPAVVDQFPGEKGGVKGGDKVIDELPHMAFKTSTPGALVPNGERYIKFQVAHDKAEDIELRDEASESVGVKVVHHFVDTPSKFKCGRASVLMCAYSTTHGERISCKATKADGSVRLSVIPGQDADIRNGCPQKKPTHDDNEPECEEVGVVKGRSVLNDVKSVKKSGKVTVAGKVTVTVTSADIQAGHTAIFEDTSGRKVGIIVGAGRVNAEDNVALVDAKDGKTGANADSLFELSQKHTDMSTFKFVAKASDANGDPLPGCDVTLLLSTGTKTGFFRHFTLPRDVPYKVHVEGVKVGVVKEYLEALPPLPIEADNRTPKLAFLFRKKATVTFHEVYKTLVEEGVLSSKSCIAVHNGQKGNCFLAKVKEETKHCSSAVTTVTREKQKDKDIVCCAPALSKTAKLGPSSRLPRGQKGFGCARSEKNAGKETLLGLTIELHVAEKYVANKETKKDSVLSALDDSGTLFTEDNVAVGAADRYYFQTGKFTSSAPYESKFTLLRCKDSSCSLTVGSDKGTAGVFAYVIGRINGPVREAPHRRMARARFAPLDKGVPVPMQVGLQTAWAMASIVVTGEVPLTFHEAIKLPEYVPFVILRNPPGDGSTTTWSKGSSTEMQIAVSVENGRGDKWELDGHVGFEHEFTAEVGTFAGIGAGVQFNVESKIGAVTVMGKTGGEWSWSRAQALNRGNKVTLTAGVSYTTSSGDMGMTGVSGDLFITPSVAIRSLTVLPILFDPAKCAGYEEPTYQNWELIDGGTTKPVQRSTPPPHTLPLPLSLAPPPHQDAGRYIRYCG